MGDRSHSTSSIEVRFKLVVVVALQLVFVAETCRGWYLGWLITIANGVGRIFVRLCRWLCLICSKLVMSGELTLFFRSRSKLKLDCRLLFIWLLCHDFHRVADPDATRAHRWGTLLKLVRASLLDFVERVIWRLNRLVLMVDKVVHFGDILTCLDRLVLLGMRIAHWLLRLCCLYVCAFLLRLWLV